LFLLAPLLGHGGKESASISVSLTLYHQPFCAYAGTERFL
jgi:hypothetical protein